MLLTLVLAAAVGREIHVATDSSAGRDAAFIAMPTQPKTVQVIGARLLLAGCGDHVGNPHDKAATALSGAVTESTEFRERVMVVLQALNGSSAHAPPGSAFRWLAFGFDGARPRCAVLVNEGEAGLWREEADIGANVVAGHLEPLGFPPHQLWAEREERFESPEEFVQSAAQTVDAANRWLREHSRLEAITPPLLSTFIAQPGSLSNGAA